MWLKENHIDDLESSHLPIFEFLLFERKVKEIELNLNDYHNSMLDLISKLENCTEDQVIKIQKEYFIDLNRTMTNFIVSLKSLIDDFLVKNKIPSIYGNPSKELAAFKKLTNNWYDSNLSYKFLMRLRDYATIP